MRSSRAAPCGDVLTSDGDRLVLDARTPLADFQPSAHRRPVLVVEGARYTLLGVERLGSVTRYTLERERESLYDLPGAPLVYDPERHLAARREAVGAAAGHLTYALLAPLMPFLGLLPAAAKRKLVALGIDPTLSTGTSLAVEWFLCWPTVALFFLSILAEARWFVVLGAALVPLTLIADLAYRWSGLQEDPPQHRGMMSVIPAFIRGVRALKEPPRLG